MIQFRTAVVSDIPLLRSLADEVWRAHYPGIISTEQIDYMLARMYAPEVIRREMAEGVVWELALHVGRPAGFLSCTHEAETARVKLHKLYLLPALHGQGIGRRILEAVKDVAYRLGAREIRLTVNKGNVKAIAAYQRAGFKITDSVVSDIGGGFLMDDYVMTIEITASGL